ncbi:MAG: polysaccharide pyruvyl transferase family protein [Gammaproteobacteria bacterium]
MRFAVLSYRASRNFGDEIQSIAAARLLPRVDLAIPREGLRAFHSDEPVVLVMNGWMHSGMQFPPGECITPFYIGFHISKKSQRFFTTPEAVSHFRKHSPIGCRDRGTVDILQQAGVDAFYSKCLTLTLPKRESANVRGGVAFVDIFHEKRINKRRIRRIIGEKCLAVQTVGHSHHCDIAGYAAKTALAESLLSEYAAAELVVTSRLHCALPCVAMGVPVLYFGAREYRTEILADIGITMHPPLMSSAKSLWQRWQEKRRFRGFDWTGETPDIETEKAAIISAFNAKLSPFL